MLEDTDNTGYKVAGKAGGTAEIGTGGLLKWFPFLTGKVSVTGEGSGELSKGDQKKQTIELLPITTPQRQLVQLALHYSKNLHDRLFFTEQYDLPAAEWRDKTLIQQTPRALCFIELPGLDDIPTNDPNNPNNPNNPIGMVPTKLIPTAAEFADGEVVLLYDQFRSKDGRTTPPKYPEYDEHEDEASRAGKRKIYWDWFHQEFDATKATLIVEQAAKAHGRVRWIDFRMPVNTSGDSLHLHVYPAEKYDIGAFAYNFIKRGYKHGLRIVGTLKSEPDVNVLAIFEK